MTDIRQSPQFARFMEDINWEVEKVDSTYIYLRKFPFLGYFAKIPRPKLPIDFSIICHLYKKRKIFRLKIAPMVIDNDKNYEYYRNQLMNENWRIDRSPFNPTITIQIDLTQSEKQIFQNFKEAKRRGVRRAIKNGLVVKESNNLEEFIDIRKKQYFPLGFLVTNEMQKLWKNFYPKNAALLLAYPTLQTNTYASICKKEAFAGILLLFYDHVAYYWFASSLKIGKKLFAPTLLVWEALKLAKKRGGKTFDFEGICDERFPEASASWKGFTKFKEGFGGKKIIYLENFSR